ncbi:Protein FAM76A-like [Oopsacas minuta]|uniref:Protein FAM76A-like n=1 Tax=Oopsacas minuta TaxID=111878 RepID=A0AAV7JZ58_9METZ|nr:Protein FAM76A-like [Oopsacas minuta]
MSKEQGEIIHQTLFACTECGARHKFVDLSPEEQLCRECRRKYPLRSCCYCQMEFYWMGSLESSAVCKRCKRDHHVHGKPTNCSYCRVKAAFSGGKCFRCQYFEAKYSTPVECNMCKTRCAFIKSEESRKKVQGQTLCYLCTLKLKKTLYRSRQKRDNENGVSPETRGSKKCNVSDSLSSDIFQDLDIKTDAKDPSTPEVDQLPGLGDLPSSRDQQMVIETIQSENMFRIEELKDEIAGLKRQLHLRDQALHEKEKNIHNLKAEIWEQEKDFKQKLSHSQFTSDEKMLQFQETIADLKKQLAKASKSSFSTNK